MSWKSWNKGRSKLTDVRIAENAAGIKVGVTAYWARLSPAERSERTRRWREGSKTPAALVKMSAAKKGQKVPKLAAVARATFTGKAKSESQRKKMAESRAAYMERQGHVYWPTSIERIVAATLTALGIAYEQQKRLCGRYVVDIFIADRNVAIECDGAYWHSRPGQADKDQARDVALKAAGYTVVRLPESTIKTAEHVDILKAAVA